MLLLSDAYLRTRESVFGVWEEVEVMVEVVVLASI